jgi:hypothetical protein
MAGAGPVEVAKAIRAVVPGRAVGLIARIREVGSVLGSGRGTERRLMSRRAGPSCSLDRTLADIGSDSATGATGFRAD